MRDHAFAVPDMSRRIPAFIGIDWGSTRLRAFQFDADGNVNQTRESDRGIATVSDGNFDRILTSMLQGWPSGLPMLMCGMVGSRHGWLEVPYHPCPMRLAELSQSCGRVETAVGPAWIIGGLTTTSDSADRKAQHGGPWYDVMRGEETQITGVAPPAGDLLTVTPGTHSKWTWVRDGIVQNFRTYMTGELYAVLRKHSILGSLMQEQESGCADAAFMDGVHTAFEDQDLLHCIFNVRTQALFNRKTPSTLSSYLSGILIGSEVAAGVRRYATGAAMIIASPELSYRYNLAMKEAGMHVAVMDGNEAVARGLWRLGQLRGLAV